MVSASILQKHIAFNVSLKLCLYLYSRRWLKLNLSLVNIFSKRVINIEDFPFSRSYKFQECITKNIIITRATNIWTKFIFHSFYVEKKSFWRIQFCKEINGKMLGCLWEFLIFGGNLWIYDGCPVERNLQRKHNCLMHLLCWRYSSPNSWYNLSREEPLMTPVIANAVLYCTNSIFLKMIHWVDGNITIVKMRSSEGFINDQSASAW